MEFVDRQRRNHLADAMEKARQRHESALMLEIETQFLVRSAQRLKQRGLGGGSSRLSARRWRLGLQAMQTRLGAFKKTVERDLQALVRIVRSVAELLLRKPLSLSEAV